MDDETLERALRELAQDDAARGASMQVEAVVMGAFRRRKARRNLWVVLTAAAALVTGIALAMLWPAKVEPQQAQTAAPDVEVGTNYFPLRAGPVLDAGELAHVIRVPATPAMLARFGITQAAGWNTVPLQADVLMGFDGTARAVRFIR